MNESETSKQTVYGTWEEADEIPYYPNVFERIWNFLQGENKKMFGFVSKKKIIEIVKPLAKEYNKPVIEEKDEQKRTNEFFYRSGYRTAINAIMYKLGIKFEKYM